MTHILRALETTSRRCFFCGVGFSAIIRPTSRWLSRSKSRDRAVRPCNPCVFRAHETAGRTFLDGATGPKCFDEATAFFLLVGERAIGAWQLPEYYETLDRRVKSADFPVVRRLLEGQTRPGLPFLRQLHWIVTPEPASEKDVARMFDAATGACTRRGELWHLTLSNRGLVAMEEKDSDYFFGRVPETVYTLKTLVAEPDKLPLLLGNSGVGKSSVAQAGMLAAFADRKAAGEGRRRSGARRWRRAWRPLKAFGPLGEDCEHQRSPRASRIGKSAGAPSVRPIGLGLVKTARAQRPVLLDPCTSLAIGAARSTAAKCAAGDGATGTPPRTGVRDRKQTRGGAEKRRIFVSGQPGKSGVRAAMRTEEPTSRSGPSRPRRSSRHRPRPRMVISRPRSRQTGWPGQARPRQRSPRLNLCVLRNFSAV